MMIGTSNNEGGTTTSHKFNIYQRHNEQLHNAAAGGVKRRGPNRASNSIDLLFDRFPELSNIKESTEQAYGEVDNVNNNKQSPIRRQISLTTDPITGKNMTTTTTTNRCFVTSTSSYQLPQHHQDINGDQPHAARNHRQSSSHSNGFLLGTFLKVWTRLKRPTSGSVGGGGAKASSNLHPTDQFEYVPAEKLANQPVRRTKLLSNEDFIHQQSQQTHQLPTAISNCNTSSSRICLSGSSPSNTGSSGISTSSSMGQLTRHQTTTTTTIASMTQAQFSDSPATSGQSSSTSPESPAGATAKPIYGRTKRVTSATGDELSSGLCRDNEQIQLHSTRRTSAPVQPATFINEHRTRQQLVSNNKLRQKNNRRQKNIGQETLSEEGDNDEEGEELSDVSGNDIYSTPNDSVVSLHQQINNQNSTKIQRSMVKSHSTNNFQQATFNYHHQQQQRTKPAIKSTNISAKMQPEVADQNRKNNNNNTNKLAKINQVNTRFFISSSSSEDSSALSTNDGHIHHHNHSLNQAFADGNLNKPTTNVRGQQRVSHHDDGQPHRKHLPLRLGVHCHSISPPSSLIRVPQYLVIPTHQATSSDLFLRNHRQEYSPSKHLAPEEPLMTIESNGQVIGHVAAMSPMCDKPQNSGISANVTSFLQPRPINFHQRPFHQASTSFHTKSPSLYDFNRYSNSQICGKNLEHSNLPIHEGPQKHSKQNVCMPNAAKDQTNNNNLRTANINRRIPNSISLYDCNWLKQSSLNTYSDLKNNQENLHQPAKTNGQLNDSEFKLAQMLLKMGPDLNVKDENGYTALMHATLSDNFATIKCLVENGSNINETNNLGLNTLDLLCNNKPNELRLKTLKFFLENGADIDQANGIDGTRLLDRLIRLHDLNGSDDANKLPYIDFLLQSGAKLGSTTWHAAFGKYDILIGLLKKLCQDGYFLYKSSSIEAAIYRFEYALKRLVELEHQLITGLGPMSNSTVGFQPNEMQAACRQLKYQTYLGLSRCELKRRFNKRALEFAQLAILIDSTAYEAYYSKAHILKNMGELNDALNTANQSLRLLDKSMEEARANLVRLEEDRVEKLVIFDANCNFYKQSKEDSELFEASKLEVQSMIDYLNEACRYINKLKEEIVEHQDKLDALGRDESISNQKI